MTLGVFVVDTVDLAGIREHAEFPIAYDDDNEYGENGFDMGDYIEPSLYQSVDCHIEWERA